MGPDSQQPQNIPTLPNVPQVTPEQPAPPVVEPTVEVQPVQEAMPIAPVAAPQVAQPVEVPVQPAPVSNPAPVVVNQFPQATAFPQSTPGQPVQQVAVPGAPAGFPPAPKKKLGLIIGLIAGGVVLLASLAVVLVLFMFPFGKVSESDLVSSTTEGTTYMRPKQWEAITDNSFSGYGDKKGKDNTSTAAIFVDKKNYIQSGVKDASSSELETFRDTLVESMTPSVADEAVIETGSCTSVENATVKKSSVATSNMVGILRVDATCKRDDGTFMVAIYVTLGEDGYLRSVVLLSTESSWKQNEAVFNKMLDSADQS